MQIWCLVMIMDYSCPPTTSGPMAGRTCWHLILLIGIFLAWISRLLRRLIQWLFFGSNDQPLDLTSPSSFDDLSNPQLSSPSDLSTLPAGINLPGQEVSAAAGESCSANGIMKSPISRRDGLDWLWNLFKGTGGSPENSPKLCPAPGGTQSPHEPEPEPKTEGHGSDGRDPFGICEYSILLCCPGELVSDSEALEGCWDCELISGFRVACWLKLCRSTDVTCDVQKQ